MTPKQKPLPDSQWLEMLFQKIPDGIVIQDSEGVIIEANAGLARLCSKPLRAITGRKFSDLLCPASKAKWSHDLDKLIKGEWSLIDGNFIFTEVRKVPVEIEIIGKTSYQGQKAVVLLVRNMSVYHTVESALLNSQNQWELSFNAINDEIYVLDQNGHILRANQTALKKITPLMPDPIGSVFFDAYRFKGGPKQDDLHAKMLAAPFSLPEAEFEKIPGKYSLASYPIKDAGQAPNGCIVVLRDVTELFRQEELIKKNEFQRQRSSRIEALGRMAGGIAHDFNNLLTTLLGYVSLVLQSDNIGQHERNYLIEIMRTVERGTALTRQLFDFSSEKKAEYKAINLNSVIQNMHKMLIQVLGPNITITTHLDQQLWNVNADVSRLERIIVNFAANSRDAMTSGGELTIETGNTMLDENFCKHHPELKPGNYVLLQVSDTGTGMKPEVFERVFEPFFTTKKRGKGLGLGLPSVFGIVRQFGGEIICYSEWGKGTTFKVYLPQSTEKIIAEKQAVTINDLPGGTETIFIVDDEVHIVSMLNQILSKIGYKVLSATSSSKAISLCKDYDGGIDVILSDIIMPDMNGVELLSTLRQDRPALKAIFMSGYTNSMAVESAGMDKNTVFLQKPFTFEELARKIREAVKKSAN